jgi:hypothetical protein
MSASFLNAPILNSTENCVSQPPDTALTRRLDVPHSAITHSRLQQQQSSPQPNSQRTIDPRHGPYWKLSSQQFYCYITWLSARAVLETSDATVLLLHRLAFCTGRVENTASWLLYAYVLRRCCQATGVLQGRSLATALSALRNSGFRQTYHNECKFLN